MKPLLCLCLVLGMGTLARSADDADWKDLFNGKDLTGFVIDGPKEAKDKKDGNKLKPLWTVRDGVIHCTGDAFGFLRYDGQKYKNFVYQVEYRFPVKEKGTNSGLGIRTTVFTDKTSKEKTDTRPSFAAYEVQLLDDGDKDPDKHSTCSLYRYVAPTAKNHKPAPEWNTVEVECRGTIIMIRMNGKEVLKADQATIEEIKNKPLEGYVCVQSHSKPVEFRKIRIKELP
jgi:hypothetical protein